MVLVDTSIWVDFLRSGDEGLSGLLTHNQVCMHPMVMGELACGNLKNRTELLQLWANLPQAQPATHSEVLYFLEPQQLMGKGIGYVDLHLLAATQLSANTQLWTRDKRLGLLADSLGCAYLNH